MNKWWKKDGEEGNKLLHREGISVMDISESELEIENKLVIDRLMKDKTESNLSIKVEKGEKLDQKLDEAILQGIKEGRRRSIKQARKRKSLLLGTTAVCMLLMLTAFVRISPTFAAMIKEIPGLSGFVELVRHDKTLMSAVDNEFIQPVNRSDERNGYKLTVNGVIADSQRAVLLYTVAGPGINEKKVRSIPKLSDENGGEVTATIVSAHYPNEEEKEQSKVQDYLDIVMSTGVPVPQKIGVKMKVGTEWLEVQVPIDHAKFAELREEIELNETIEVADHRIHIKKAVITPLQVSITFEGDATNVKRVNDFIDLELVDDRGRTYKTNMGSGYLDTGITRHFQSAYFHKPKSLKLIAKGVKLSERDLTVVIDTEKKVALSVPDSKLQLSNIYTSDQYIDLEFKLLQNDEPSEQIRQYLIFNFDAMFRDASGKTYPIERGDRKDNVATYVGGDELTGTYYYHIANKDYVQPLTFEIYEYPGYILEDISVDIK
ncbi:DUF4179 domain-containing protein [Paenibacillus sp. GSMTC-2017]|uniref:DUF4179 domain-containing protein n=1 Tax=Paenibacillus sp. GSMTC-2017 TaxID=2794350 RepID=UPI0018D6FFFE|nr:DUF4179 domain-containing protein [Paenibacillus sp. GSMTC-2017]MBH5320851.1 DUF4179 domain-containing protein [Paenibacillus sp. GSMTC-2017]